MVTDFLAYERSLGLSFLIPLLDSQEITLTGKSVLDLGCGYGGVLAVLQEKYGLGEALGIDLDPEMIRKGLLASPPGVKLETGDFFAMDDQLFDFILMRDVLEHIVDVERALIKATRLLKPGGRLYASFAPFYSPFGGHQHNCAGIFSNIPWIQFLPEAWFRKILRLEGNSYKSAVGLVADMETVLKTRLTISGFRRMLPRVGLQLRFQARYLIRPDFKIKFGLPAMGFPPLAPFDDLLCTGFEAILVKA
jgi:ubiquinone/menaquinone biosynthesis C-methylase UbiE